MSPFRPKRVSGAELAGRLAPVTAHLPAAEPARPPRPAPPRAPRKVQVNFEVSEAFAELIAREAARAGSTRRLFARLMREAGHEVPEADVHPPDTRRRRGAG